MVAMNEQQPPAAETPATLREIYEQPAAIAATLAAYTVDGALRPDAWAATRAVLAGAERLLIAASGTSRHAGLTAEIMIEELSGVAVDVEYASEYPYRRHDTLSSPAVLVISQSGETADTLAALAEARRRGAKSISLTNVEGSTMAREADAALLTRAGKEVAIAATKSFTTQLTVLELVSLLLAEMHGRLSAERIRTEIARLAALPDLIAARLPGWQQQMQQVAQNFREADAFLYLGRALHYPIAREGALKLKEVSYIHAEAYPTGELKHGPNALLGAGSSLVVLATRDEHDESSMLRYRKALQLLRDIAAQGSRVLAIATDGDTEIASVARDCVFVPAVHEYQAPIIEIIPLQLFAYFMSLERGNDVDRPRNLVKAVTVE